MRQWYYIVNEAQKGPISEDKLLALFSSGQLARDTLVWTGDMKEWTSAANIEGLGAPDAALPSIPKASSSAPRLAPSTSQKALFLYIPIARLVWMSIASWGLYEAYWIYKNWRYIKERDGLKIKPFWRGIFGVFFITSLFKTIRNDREAGPIVAAGFSAGGLAAGWIILIIIGNMLGRADNAEVNLLGLVLSFPSFLFFVPVQNYINRVNLTFKPTPAYSPWSAGHIVCLVIGILFWVLILAGIILPE